MCVKECDILNICKVVKLLRSCAHSKLSATEITSGLKAIDGVSMKNGIIAISRVSYIKGLVMGVVIIPLGKKIKEIVSNLICKIKNAFSKKPICNDAPNTGGKQ